MGRDRAININTELLREDVERWAKAHGVLTTALRVEVEQQLQLDLGGS